MASACCFVSGYQAPAVRALSCALGAFGVAHPATSARFGFPRLYRLACISRLFPIGVGQPASMETSLRGRAFFPCWLLLPLRQSRAAAVGQPASGAWSLSFT